VQTHEVRPLIARKIRICAHRRHERLCDLQNPFRLTAGRGNTRLSEALKQVDLDFATAATYIYWPFNGEFWSDELGYYHYTERSSCK
jgi:hypothetical protein